MIAGTAGGGGAKGRDEGCADGDGQRAAEGRPSPRLGCVAPDHPDGDGGAHRVGRGDDLEAQEELGGQPGIPSKKSFTNDNYREVHKRKCYWFSTFLGKCYGETIKTKVRPR